MEKLTAKQKSEVARKEFIRYMEKLTAKQKSEVARKEFIRYMKEGTATLKTDIAPQENARKKVQHFLDKKIVDLVRGLNLAKELPLGEMLYVRASLRVYTKDMSSYVLRDTDMIVTPITINKDSVRCILWTQQYHSWDTNRMTDGIIESKKAIRFIDILSWKKWSPNDAPLTINHLYQSPAYKRLAYGM